MVNRGQRKKSDFYETPYSLTWQLLINEHFSTGLKVLEPAYGNGAIVRVLKGFNYKVLTMDIAHGEDFLQCDIKVPYIITNPPFSLALEFIEKCKKVATKKFALLFPLSYLHGQERYEKKVFRDLDYPLKTVHVFTRYPMLGDKLRADGKYKTGMMVYAWFVWEKVYDVELDELTFINIPGINWIDNNEYVLGKNDLP